MRPTPSASASDGACVVRMIGIALSKSEIGESKRRFASHPPSTLAGPPWGETVGATYSWCNLQLTARAPRSHVDPPDFRIEHQCDW